MALPALPLAGLIGAGAGAVSPGGYNPLVGAARGILRGVGTGAGALAGGLGANLLSTYAPNIPWWAHVLGMGAGIGLGGGVGNLAANAVLGDDDPDRQKREKKNFDMSSSMQTKQSASPHIQKDAGMRKLSHATETKLFNAIRKSAQFVAKGMPPNQAIAKAAMEDGIGPGYVQPMIHAYNIGKANRQRQDGATVFEKAADFELADTAKVLELMYPTTVKSAAEIQKSTAVSPAYDSSPRGLLEARNDRHRIKAAGTTIAPQKMPLRNNREEPKDPMRRLQNATGKAQSLTQETERSRANVSSMMDQLAGNIRKLAAYFRRSDAIPIPVVADNVKLLHGPAGEQVFAVLSEQFPGVTKLAHHTLGTTILGPEGQADFSRYRRLPATGEAYNLVATIVKQAAEYQQAKQAHEILAAKNQKEAEETLRPFVPARRVNSIFGHSALVTETEKAAMGPSKATANVMPILGSAALMNQLFQSAGKGIQAPSDSSLIRKNLDDLTDPEHEAKLRAINTQATLQDFIINDPIISNYDPEEVTTAFNEITQAAPHMTDQRLGLQTLLRKRLQQGIFDQFELGQIMDMEEKLRKRDMGPMLAQRGYSEQSEG
jgi:hypothetical protein